MTNRIIGIRHRRKRTTAGEARPTEVAILASGQIKTHDLEDDTAEKDFLLGQFPIARRKVESDEDLSNFKPHQITWKKVKKAEVEAGQYPQKLLARPGNQWLLATHVPTEFDGLRAGDTVAMALGGSGDRLAYALTNRALRLGNNTYVMRLQPADLKRERGSRGKDDDAKLLIDLILSKPELFYETGPRDLQLIAVTELWRERQGVMKDRIACEQRMQGQEVGRVFLNQAGEYPEGSIEATIKAREANDQVFLAILAEEQRVIRELTRRIEQLDVYTEVFATVEGVGPLLAARIIPEVRDIRRFAPEYPDGQIQTLQAEHKRLQEAVGLDALEPKVAEQLGQMEKTKPQYRYRRIQLIRNWLRTNGREEEAAQLDRVIAIKRQIHGLRLRAENNAISRFMKYCGVHVDQDGAFPRQRRGADNDNRWSRNARQAFFLFAGDQCVKRPQSEWGQRLLANKASYRQRCPVKVSVRDNLMGAFRAFDRRLRRDQIFLQHDLFIEPDKCKVESKEDLIRIMDQLGVSDAVRAATMADLNQISEAKGLLKVIYSDGHIHKMATWRTATQFAKWLWRAWWQLEVRRQRAQSMTPPTDDTTFGETEELPADEAGDDTVSSAAA